MTTKINKPFDPPKEFRDQVQKRADFIRSSVILDETKQLFAGRNFNSSDFQQRLLSGHLISIHVGDTVDKNMQGLEQLPLTAEQVEKGRFDIYLGRVLIAGQALDYQIEKTVDFH